MVPSRACSIRSLYPYVASFEVIVQTYSKPNISFSLPHFNHFAGGSGGPPPPHYAEEGGRAMPGGGRPAAPPSHAYPGPYDGPSVVRASSQGMYPQGPGAPQPPPPSYSTPYGGYRPPPSGGPGGRDGSAPSSAPQSQPPPQQQQQRMPAQQKRGYYEGGPGQPSAAYPYPRCVVPFFAFARRAVR